MAKLNIGQDGSQTTVVATGNGISLTLPTATDTIVGRATADTLTNKAIDGTTNTVTKFKTYSATETNTGNVWVDGRTIYRKVLRGQLTVAAATNTIAHGITGLTTAMEFISINGGIKLGATSNAQTSFQSLMYREAAGNWISLTSIDATNISLTSAFAWGNSYYFIILEYAK